MGTEKTKRREKLEEEVKDLSYKGCGMIRPKVFSEIQNGDC